MSVMASQITNLTIVCSPFIQAHTKENIKENIKNSIAFKY